jgi:hypothetical protein
MEKEGGMRERGGGGRAVVGMGEMGDEEEGEDGEDMEAEELVMGQEGGVVDTCRLGLLGYGGRIPGPFRRAGRNEEGADISG